VSPGMYGSVSATAAASLSSSVHPVKPFTASSP
jgi:hypothetical protein